MGDVPRRRDWHVAAPIWRNRLRANPSRGHRTCNKSDRSDRPGTGPLWGNWLQESLLWGHRNTKQSCRCHHNGALERRGHLAAIRTTTVRRTAQHREHAQE